MKITIFQGFIEGIEEEETNIYEGHLTSEQVEAIAYQFGNIGNGGYARMVVEPGFGKYEGHFWKINYYNTPEPEPETIPGPDTISTVGDEWGVEGEEEGIGDLSYTVAHSETQRPPVSSPMDIGSQI